VGNKWSTKGKEHQDPYSPPLSVFIVSEVKTIPLPQCPTEEGKNVLLCMCCALPSMAEYQKCFVSPCSVIKDVTALPTAWIISSKGKSITELYSELGCRKAYSTAILAGDESARQQLQGMDKHDKEEIMKLLNEAEEEVIAEIKIEQELSGQCTEWAADYDTLPLPSPYPEGTSMRPFFDNVPVTWDGPVHPPIGVETAILNNISDNTRCQGGDMGWNCPSVSTAQDA
jgi:hypothetical protein